MPHKINLCTSVLPDSPFADVIAMALEAGFDGIELRVHDAYHRSLATLEEQGPALRRDLERLGLDIPVLNTYVGINDEPQVHRLIGCAKAMEVPRLRLTLPRSGNAAVAKLSREKEPIPSYEAPGAPLELLRDLRRRLSTLEQLARANGVQILVELHWGTVMSSFTSAHLLLDGFDPAALALTFDPANMVVEGREDWEFGVQLTRTYIANVHVKNAAWTSSGSEWRWHWSPVFDGLVPWPEMIALLQGVHYAGAFAIEDFLTPRSSPTRIVPHLTALRALLATVCRHPPPRRPPYKTFCEARDLQFDRRNTSNLMAFPDMASPN
jgi:sugar phosphate isomerase/epimerase